jgi:hypothetical protein
MSLKGWTTAVAFLTLVAGCVASPYRPIESPAAMNGTYRNVSREFAASTQPVNNATLWKFLRPWSKHAAGPVVDERDDRVRLTVGPDGTVTSTLIRDGRAVAEQTARFSTGHDRAGRDAFRALAKPLPPLLWATFNTSQEIGLSAEGADALRVEEDGGGLLWAVFFPIGGGDAGEGVYHFDRIEP